MFSRLFLSFVLLFSPLIPSYAELFDLKSLALGAADKALQAHTADMIYAAQVVDDPALTAYVNQVRAKMDPWALHTKIPVSILKTSRIQGISQVGPSIAITRGMMNMIGDEAELACLIAHEIGHADLNHTSQTDSPSVIDHVVSTGALVAANSAGVGDVAADINKNRQVIMAAAWSQEREEQADQYGAVLAAKAGYDPYALCDLFDRLLIKVQATGIDQGLELTSSHKSFTERSKHLRQFLAAKGYQPGKGLRGKEVYLKNLTSIETIHTEEALNDSQKQDIADLDRIKDELTQLKAAQGHLKPKRFLEIMRRYSQYAKKYHITRDQLAQLSSNFSSASKAGAHFMADNVEQDSLFNPQFPNDLGPAGNSLVQGLDLIAHLGLAMAAPEVMVPVMAYEAIAGQDFFTGQNLSSGQRALSALGTLVPGLPKRKRKLRF